MLTIKSSHLLIDFAFGLPSSFADHYLNCVICTNLKIINLSGGNSGG